MEEQVHKDLMALAERARDVQRFLTNAMTLQVQSHLSDSSRSYSLSTGHAPCI